MYWAIVVVDVLPVIFGTHHHCSDPDDLPTTKSFMDGYDESLALMEFNNRDVIVGVPCMYVNIRRTRVNVTRIENDAYESQMERAMCESGFYRNQDSNRKPEILYERRCESEFCRNCGHRRRMRNGKQNKCKEIIFYVKVLRRVGCDSEFKYEYNEVYEPLGAGCTCLTPARDIQLVRHAQRVPRN